MTGLHLRLHALGALPTQLNTVPAGPGKPKEGRNMTPNISQRDTENFSRVLAEDNATAIMDAQGSIDAIRFASGSAIAWRAPVGATPGTREYDLGAKLTRTVAKAHDAIAKIQADPTRTHSWKVEQFARIAAESAAAFAAERRDADAVVTAFNEADRREAMPPPLAPTDAVGGGRDQWLVDRVLSLDREGAASLSQELLDGKHVRVLEALMRAPSWPPLPAPIAAVLNESWQRQRLANDPQGARMRQRAVERIGWLRTIADQAQGALPLARPTLAQERNAAIAARAA